MIKVGVTGGIGSGKSFVCKLFESKGIPVYYADDRAKKLMLSNKKLKSDIKELLGQESYFRNGRINRKYISSLVFNDKSLLKRLNAIIHPAVLQDSEEWFSQQKTIFAIKEAALLIESLSYKTLDKIIVVTAPEKLRIERVVKRDKTSIEKVKERMKNQLKDTDTLKYADYIILNDGNNDLLAEVNRIYYDIIENNS
jgi:dephospho-CoA kinase